MKYKYNIIKRLVNVLIISLLLIIGFACINYSQVNQKEDYQYNNFNFSNHHFNTDLLDLSDDDKAETFRSYSIIHKKIEELMVKTYPTDLARDEDIEQEIIKLVKKNETENYRVSIASAQELYDFSTDVSYNWKNPVNVENYPHYKTIKKLLSLDYVLLNDIDYSEMRARKFIPIGIDLNYEGKSEDDYNPFTGTFDGQGYTISNLFVADYDYFTVRHIIDGDITTEMELPMSPYYSIFGSIGEGAIIRNLRIVNPIFELLDAPESLIKVAVFAGENKGTIYNVGVIDIRENENGDSISGIRFNVQYPTETDYTAAGFVHTNTGGKIYNSFYASDNVLATASKHRFDFKPFIYINKNNKKSENEVIEPEIIGACYDSMYIPDDDSDDPLTQPSGITVYSTEQLHSGFINPGDQSNPENPDFETDPEKLIVLTKKENIPSEYNEKHRWRFYSADGYPSFLGLDYDFENDCFLIKDEYDFLTFSILINKTTRFLGKSYNQHKYVIVNNIDMSNITGYQTPTQEFMGILTGGDDDFVMPASPEDPKPKHIYNLVIKRPYIANNNYYLGLTSLLSGKIQNLYFSNCSVVVADIKDLYGYTFYIGTLASYLKTDDTRKGTIKNIVLESTIDLGAGAIGKTYAGGIVGYGSGDIANVANKGLINGNTHVYNGLTINPYYCLGGIIGSSAGEGLSITNSINYGNIVGLSSDSNFNVQAGSSAVIKLGGIIGQINNETTKGNSIFYVSNYGKITGGQYEGKAVSEDNPEALVYQYLGGIFGDCIGNANRINEGSTIINGKWLNGGIIEASYTNQYTYYYGAGIGVASTSSPKAEFSYMNNTYYEYEENKFSGGHNFNFNIATHNINMFYASTIIDNSSGGIILSRAYNDVDYTFDEEYFQGTLDPTKQIKIGCFFTSIHDVESELIYCQNDGNLTVGNTSDYTEVKNEMRIAGITLATKINYKNVYQTGNITVTKITQEDSVYVAGIAWILPYIQATSTPFKAINCINEGKIVTAGFNGNTTVNSTNDTSTSFQSRMDFSNIYVAGLFNINVGEVYNSVNRGDITSTGEGASDIEGSGNTFVGGIVTFNYNYIQDCANMGNLYYYNSDENQAATYVCGGTNPNTTSLFGGLVYAYRSGLTLGGIAAAFVDNTAKVLENYGRAIIDENDNVLSGRITAKIEDTANNGNVYGKSKSYVRCGGILGVALGTEVAAGTDDNSSAGGFTKFGYSATGAADPIGGFLLSNGLNFGNIIAITETIGYYLESKYYGSSQGNNYATSQRPGIFSCAGGVIGYGLCGMIRMINHGVVTATDVAGGIIGSTYIIGKGDSEYDLPVTFVNMNTAVHYGKVMAAKYEEFEDIDYTSILNEIENVNDEDFTLTLLHPDGNTFMFPILSSGNSLALYPNNKRGFGGIFGRLQRGYRGIMQSNNFVNILNMDSDVDMIGRADQGSYTSYFYYRFTVNDREDTYYTARQDDTTPIAFSGYYTSQSNQRVFSGADSVAFRIYRNGTNYFVNRIVSITGGYGEMSINYTRNVGVYTQPKSNGCLDRTQIVDSYINFSEYESFQGYNRTSYFNITQINIESFGFTEEQKQAIRNLGISNRGTRNITFTNYTNDTGNFAEPAQTVSTSVTQHKIEVITDDHTVTTATYIFDPEFPLMKDSEFIYFAEKDVLAPRFNANPASAYYKPNGMYVLASTDGKINGAVLPSNIKIEALFKLDESETKYIKLYDEENEEYVADSTIPIVASEGGLENNMMDQYESMFQVSYNDKSAIMPHIEDSELGNIILGDDDGDIPTLQNGILSVVETEEGLENRITFIINRDALTQEGSIYYKVLFADLSENAVIGVVPESEADFKIFNEYYKNRTSNILGGDYELILSATSNLTAGSLTFLDKITVYSEIACHIYGYAERVNDDGVFKYKTEYTIVVEVESSQGLDDISLSSVLFDSSSITPPAIQNKTFVIPDTHKLSPNGTIVFTFNANDLLPVDHMSIWTGLFYGEDTVSEDYYTYRITPVNNNIFTITITLKEELKAGLYTIKYKYYSNIEDYLIVFTKNLSDKHSLTSISYLTYSSDPDGLSTVLTPDIDNPDSYTTYIEFARILPFVPYGTPISSINNQDLTFSSLENPGISYLDDKTYYQIKINEIEIINISLSPYAVLNSVSLCYKYDANNMKYYEFRYNVSDESGNQAVPKTSEIIVHTIKERVPKLIIYKNGNREYTTDLTVRRNDFITNIDIDFGFFNSDLYKQVSLEVFNNDGTSYEYGDEIRVQAFSAYFGMVITADLGLGKKTYQFNILREIVDETEFIYTIGSITIEKTKGTSAYLQDVVFQISSDMIFSYPLITALIEKENGELIENVNYDPLMYYDGIDYDKADVDGVKIFHIHGEVSHVDIEYYAPLFRIPLGAKIQRYIGNDEWSDQLEGNYIGFEEDPNDFIWVKYRIIPEVDLDDQGNVISDANAVYYYISVEDIKYNLTIRFTLYYESNGELIEASDETSPIKNRVVLINVRNYQLEEGINYVPGSGEVYPFEGIIKQYFVYDDNLPLLNSKATMFYFPPTIENYIITFGRNLSGCYGFSITTPIYNGPTSGDFVSGERYDYSIYLKPKGVDDWKTDENLLPDLDNHDPELDEFGNYVGKYFYIEGTTRRQRIREFAIVIHDNTVGVGWGLYKDDTSWDN